MDSGHVDAHGGDGDRQEVDAGAAGWRAGAGSGSVDSSKGGGELDSWSVFPVLAFLGTALVLLFMVNQYYKTRSKPRRKKQRGTTGTGKRYSHMVYGGGGFKPPAV